MLYFNKAVCTRKSLANMACGGHCFVTMGWQRYLQVDECACELAKCANYALCRNEAPEHVLEARGGVCFCCSHLFGSPLRIAYRGPRRARCPCCNVRLQNEPQLLFGCEHRLCCRCMREDMRLRTVTDIRAAEFGFPLSDASRMQEQREWEEANPEHSEAYRQACRTARREARRELRLRRRTLLRCRVCRRNSGVLLADCDALSSGS